MDPIKQHLQIDLSPIRLELAHVLTKSSFSIDTTIDIVVRCWELMFVDPLEYPDELYSIIYDELHHCGRKMFGYSSDGRSVIDNLADFQYKLLHDFLMTIRPILENTVGQFRITDHYEYSITDIKLFGLSLVISLVRSDKIADYYRSKEYGT